MSAHKCQTQRKDSEYRIPDPEVIKKSCSAQLSMKFFLLINVKMPTVFGLLTFINSIGLFSNTFLSDDQLQLAGNTFCSVCFHYQMQALVAFSRNSN